MSAYRSQILRGQQRETGRHTFLLLSPGQRNLRQAVTVRLDQCYNEKEKVSVPFLRSRHKSCADAIAAGS